MGRSRGGSSHRMDVVEVVALALAAVLVGIRRRHQGCRPQEELDCEQEHRMPADAD